MSVIASILPKGEGFSTQQFGAVALCVRDFTLHSRYREQTAVIGNVAGDGFDTLRYIPFAHVPWYENRTRSYARQCVNWMNRENIKLAEIHNRPNLVRLIAPRVRFKIALHLHNDPQEIDYTRTIDERRKLLHLVEAVYCVSGYIRDRFLSGLASGAQAKVHVIYNGIALPATSPQKEKQILFAGRMTEGKGALMLAQALCIALPQIPEWRAILIGSRRHSVAQSLTLHEQQILETLQPVLDQVELPGFLPHEAVLSAFATAEIAVIPSLWQEPFGRTAIEAMAAGCAVISSGRGGLREVTLDAALTPDDMTAERLARSIVALARDPGQRQELQQRARVRARYFSIAERTLPLDNVRAAILQTVPLQEGARHAV